MARLNGLLVLAVLALSSLLVSADVRPWLIRPPPAHRRQPPRTNKPPSGNPTVVPEVPTKEVTITVTGEIAVQTAHTPADPDADPYDLPPQLDTTYRLVDKSSSSNETSVDTKVDFGEERKGLITGDIVEVPLTLTLPASVVDLLEGISNGTRRRRLTEDEHHLRRTLIEYHNTRRSLAEFADLTALIRGVVSSGGLQSIVNLTPKARGVQQTGKVGGVKDLMIVGDMPLNVTSVTFVFQASACGLVPKNVNKQWVEQRWDVTKAPSGGVSLQRYHEVCSYNKLNFPQALNKVYGPIDIPCTGTQPSKGKYNLQTGCDDPELYGMWDIARSWLKTNDPAMSKILETIRRKIIVFPFPRGGNCGWAGTASVGCPGGGDCLTWMSPRAEATYLDMSTVFHELAHNIGLSHSARVKCDGYNTCELYDYGDKTDFMGSGYPADPQKTYLCAAAPQAYKAGWAGPLNESGPLFAGGAWAEREIKEQNKLFDFYGEFNYSAVKGDFSRNIITLPAMGVTDKNFMRIAIDQNGIVSTKNNFRERAIFVSYRSVIAGNSYDNGLSTDFNRRVFIHEFNETADNRPTDGDRPPIILAVLDAMPASGKANVIGDSWGALPDKYIYNGRLGRLIIKVSAKGPTNATVQLCYAEEMRETEDTCRNEVDDDCDGLTDAADPDCEGVDPVDNSPPPPPPAPKFKARSPPPPPPPTRSPPPKAATKPAKRGRHLI